MLSVHVSTKAKRHLSTLESGGTPSCWRGFVIKLRGLGSPRSLVKLITWPKPCCGDWGLGLTKRTVLGLRWGLSCPRPWLPLLWQMNIVNPIDIHMASVQSSMLVLQLSILAKEFWACSLTVDSLLKWVKSCQILVGIQILFGVLQSS